MATDPVRAEHDAVLSALSTRESIKHYGHAAVSILVAVALTGTATKLWWDYWGTNPEWAAGFGALAALILSYAAVRLVLGARANTRERVQLVRLLELRKTLGVDAPASLTPQAT